MRGIHWFELVDAEYKARVLEVASGRAFSLPKFVPNQGPDSAESEKFHSGMLTGDLLKRYLRRRAEAWKDFPSGVARLNEVVRWRKGLELPPPMIRQCARPACREFFAVTNRAAKTYCGRKCTAAESARRAMKAKHDRARRPMLMRAKRAVNQFREQPDWKQRASEAAGVTLNFISFAVRRGEIVAPDAARARTLTQGAAARVRVGRRGTPRPAIAHIGSEPRTAVRRTASQTVRTLGRRANS